MLISLVVRSDRFRIVDELILILAKSIRQDCQKRQRIDELRIVYEVIIKLAAIEMRLSTQFQRLISFCRNIGVVIVVLGNFI